MLFHPSAESAAQPTIGWIDQFGGRSGDYSQGVSADGLGNVYTAGLTFGDYAGTSSGSVDVFLSKYDATGALLWSEQLGTSSYDYGYGVSADVFGNVYISGYTGGNLGGNNAGNADAFISKYSSSGNLLWTEQLGTSKADFSYSVSTDGLGNAYISGHAAKEFGGNSFGSYNAFVSKFNTNGTQLWTEQFGTSDDEESYGVAADGLGNIYISGWTEGDFEGTNAGGRDAFLSKLDSDGMLLWTKQLGTIYRDEALAVTADVLGSVFISGNTRGSLKGLNAGGADAFVSKFDASGTHLWTEQFGTIHDDEALGLSVDGLGSVYVSGFTGGSNFGTTGVEEAFLSKFDATGSLLWTEQIGTNSRDYSYGVSADGLGSVYMSGYTFGSLEGTNAGHYDAFIAKFGDPIPEPCTLLLGAMACIGLVIRRRL